MSDKKLGQVGWFDLTVADADTIRDFYGAVVGWESDPHDMGEYSDYVMKASDGTPIGGICHARGPNAEIPPHWLMYIAVKDLDASLEQVQSLGGKAITPARDMGGYGTVAIIQDPAGAVSALIQPE